MVDDDRSILQCLAAVTVTSCVGACGVIVVMINYVKISGEAEALVATKHLLLTRLMTVTQLMLKGKSATTRILYTVSQKKGATLTMAMTLSILGGFAKFFHCCKEQ